ncbi:peptidase M66 [Vibrio fortis]|uniref:Peptidase M66 n=1 Tax=Vibrio fortis TaxID=212667 RepID=A0A066UPY9_9VIBR|nr:M66 family metalloprotease [Vibrio fortis]KDN26253.1 peptidase M66 [Vibrio fortis]
MINLKNSSKAVSIAVIIFSSHQLIAENLRENSILEVETSVIVNKDDGYVYYYLSNDIESNSFGYFSGIVRFSQTHTLTPTGNSEEERPRLTAKRNALLLFTPTDVTHDIKSLTATVTDGNGNELGEIHLAHPNALPNGDKPKKSHLVSGKPEVKYVENTWSGNIPWNWVEPGMRIIFTDDQGKNSYLDEVDVGAENEVVLQNIRIGMLTKPTDIHRLEQTPMLAADYFQKIPVSKLIVGNYSPIQLDEIMLPDGTFYTDRSETTGGVYSGDMRERIGKSLISMGINNANFGINDSPGTKQWQPGLFNQYVIHKARGFYKNGVVEHGLSGGNGMATLKRTIGNEFSHELGHAYGLGHYPGGGYYSNHGEHSTWGWDDLSQQFISNFIWEESGSTVGKGHTTPSYLGVYKFNRDAMGGGSAKSYLSEYTHYTDYTAKRIQSRFENTGRLKKDGYYIWDENTKGMIPKSGSVPKNYGVEVTTLVGFYDPKNEIDSYIYPELYGSYGHVYSQGTASPLQCRAEVSYDLSEKDIYPLTSERRKSDEMNKFHFNVSAEKKPNLIEIFCPTANYDELFSNWLMDELEVKEFNSWGENNRKGEVGQVFYYSKYDYYFRLKTTSYWYFPSKPKSNRYWEFLGTGEDFKREFSKQVDNGELGEFSSQLLVSKDLSQPKIKPRPAVIVGEEYQYEVAKRLSSKDVKTFLELDALLQQQDFGNFEEFSKYIKNYYNVSEVKSWSDSRQGEVGDIYSYSNPYSGTQDYFILIESDYGYFPTHQYSNKYWRYLGSSDEYINFNLNPFYDLNSKTLNEEELLLTQFGKKDIYSWSQRKSTKEVGEVFVYNNPYNKNKDYFLQKRPGSGWYYPKNSESNNDWIYIGSLNEIKEYLLYKNSSSINFENSILDWYKQDEINRWERNRNGIVGDIYVYEYRGRNYYYRLKSSRYGYFPKPNRDGVAIDSNNWEFLGEGPK